jgi:glycosyltransferase involved in cell wall biosynthesis
VDINKKIVIITTNPFPIGLAATNRIFSYGRGFLNHGHQPEVICMRPTESYTKVFNRNSSGIYKGIRYTYPGRTTVRVKSFWGRRLNDTGALISSILLFINLLFKKEISFSIFYGTTFFPEILFISISKIFGKDIYKEESENPYVYFGEKRFIHNKIVNWFYINRLYRYYDGVIVMTHALYDFFLGKGVNYKKILIVPQTVDLERFENVDNNFQTSFDFDYIAYVGSLNQKKDGVLTLIESFKNVSKEFPDLKLIIAGDGDFKERATIAALMEFLNLEERVQLIGRISSEEIPQFLMSAKVLASCRPYSMQSDYGFPTKVIEYLASGKPTVTTATGELSKFIEDRVNSFVVSGSNKEDFSQKLTEVLNNYKFAMKVAENGKKQVRISFNPIIQTRKIIGFYEKVLD